MSHLDQYSAAEALESHLGDPGEGNTPFSFARLVALDEEERYPEEACGLLNQWGFPSYFVPADQGGNLRSVEELIALFRVVARRDLTVAVSQIISCIGATPVWVDGSAVQRARAAALLACGQQISFALTERAHGSDLLANEMEASPRPEGFSLSGEKWLIGNANRCQALTVFVKTAARGGPAAFSMFFLEKEQLDRDAWSPLPRERTLGLRGMDLSGLRFESCQVPDTALVGTAGHGLEILLRAQQIARVVICALSLGAADTALASTLRFARQRRLYGNDMLSIPQVRARLAAAWTDILVCECLMMAVTRAMHCRPEQMSVLSAVAKCFVPPVLDAAIGELSRTLGARYFLRTGHDGGIFQKIVRDHAVLSVVESSTAVNQKAIAMQLGSLAARRQAGAEGPGAELRERAHVRFCLEEPLPALAISKLSVSNQGADDTLADLPGLISELSALQAGPGLSTATVRALVGLAQELLRKVQRLDAAVAERTGGFGNTLVRHPELMDLAREYASLHAAGACLQVWLHNRHRLAAALARGAWLVLALDRLLHPPDALRLRWGEVEETVAALVELTAEGRVPSLVPLAQPWSNMGKD